MSEPAAPVPSGSERPLLQGILWGVLFVFLTGVVVAAVLQRRAAREEAARPRAPESIRQIPAFRLTDQHGRPFGSADLAGAPWVAQFIFTRCRGPCPAITAQMAELEAGYRKTQARFVSFSVDPEFDTPAVLSAYATRYKAGPRWRFLTGSRDGLYRLVVEGFLMTVQATPEDTTSPVLHSTRFVLVDREGRLRAAYDSNDAERMKELRRDLDLLLAGR